MSIAAQTFGSFCAEDLLKPGMPEKFVEIIEGELVVMTPAQRPHNIVSENLFLMFHEFCKSRPELDRAHDNEGFLLRRNPDNLLSPDVSLFRRRPLTGKTWLEFSPEIAVEILSESNSKAEIVYKRREYLDAGGEQVWIVDPDRRTLDIYFRDGRRVTAQGEETVRGEGIAEGMEIPLAELFRIR